MRHVLAVLIAAAGVLSAPLVSAAPATEPAKPSPAGPSLAPALEPIAFYLGSYTIDATWAFGGGLTARAFYTPGPCGMFVEADIYPSDNGGAFYHRYHSVIAYDPDAHAMTSYDFTFDGSVAVTPITLRTEDGRTVADSTWPNGAIREQLAQQPDGSLAWKAWMRAPD